ncbi:sensor histidine kinase [Amycolatopsis saalfeldensis]|uniref:histidine kinase n=1 Tax=Amycolatopsis saalfeldensis TaxID=394193 RepID=A0A1H8VUJ4_9PSEU|nr:HAMP domain-containing sensor histidine kinase [Amycolatopsis saalfeldensis]SEP18963.1 two-component system, OmpR family, sensor histidine kinase MtrB [Amycolatopsis saalfeldensis]
MKAHRLRQWLAGLRPRLVLSFAAMTLVGAAAAAGASYVSARTTILSGVQDPAMTQLRDQVTVYLPQLRLPPDQAQLDRFANNLKNLKGNPIVVYRDLTGGSNFTPQAVPAELRRAVAAGETVQFQRVTEEGIPMLFIGMPVLEQTAAGATEHTGVEVYAWVWLTAQEDSINQLAVRAWQTAALALPIAVALALLAARQVLRPVRALNTAARKLGHGQLDVRLPAKGSDELAELVTTFNSTAAELERTVGSLRAMEADARRFVADVSHELRTPLAAMNAVTDVLDEDAEQLPADTAVAARLVSAETRRLTRLVQDLVEISRFDAGRAELRLDEWDVATAVADSIGARGWSAADGIVTDLPAGIVATLDPRRLDIVVANLVGNALRHGEPPVEVRLGSDGTTVTLAVTDHGPGIPAEVLPHVFDRFTKADSSRARSEGSGLGLSIARENARLHGGDIEAGNTLDGARFVLRLPRRARPPEPR